MSLRWDKYYLKCCLEQAKMSKDPSTQVGAVLVGPDREQISTGFNGFPRGIDDDYRLHDSSVKHDIIIHAEMNAILNAARIGTAVKGARMYMIAISSGIIWSGAPCVRCATHIIQAGITEVNFIKTSVPDRWKESMDKSMFLMHEAGLTINQIELDPSEFT